MIYINHMSKYYPSKNGRRYIFKDVNVVIPTDRSVGILGPNGAGKSTLMRMIGGSDRPNQGHVISDCNISWPIGLGGGLQGSMTARENVRFVARINGIKATKPIESFVEDFAEIGSYFDEPIKNYSSGMKARVGFGLSFAFDFDVLLMDEIGAVGDKNFRQKSQKLLTDKISNSRVFLVSHNISEHKRLCSSGIVIKQKNLIYHEDIHEAIEDYERTYSQK